MGLGREICKSAPKNRPLTVLINPPHFFLLPAFLLLSDLPGMLIAKRERMAVAITELPKILFYWLKL